MALVIVLNAEQLSRLASIAKATLPNESCAFLLGRSEQHDESVVVEVMPMRNSEQSPYSFSISPEELLQAYELAEQKALQVVGIFHSHPGDPSPSSTDKKFMEINPVVWVIYSTTQRRFKAYLGDGRVQEVDIRIRG
jgi:proteasome lid subunit RPN8/RPN11